MRNRIRYTFGEGVILNIYRRPKNVCVWGGWGVYVNKETTRHLRVDQNVTPNFVRILAISKLDENMTKNAVLKAIYC